MSHQEPVTLASSAQDSGLAVLIHGVLSDAARRHGGRLPGLHSRIALAAIDNSAGEEVTLELEDGRCVIEAGQVRPDLVLAVSSELLPRLQAVPTLLGLPLLASGPGLSLLQALLSHPLRVRDAAVLLINPRQSARAALDVWRLIRLVAGG